MSTAPLPPVAPRVVVLIVPEPALPALLDDAMRLGAEVEVARSGADGRLSERLRELVRSAGVAAAPASELTVVGDWRLDRSQPTVAVRVHGQWRAVDLPPTERRLLEVLLAQPDRVRSRADIRAEVWGDQPVDERTVDQYVRRLRCSLAKVQASAWVQTVSRSGYRVVSSRHAPVTAVSRSVPRVPASNPDD